MLPIEIEVVSGPPLRNFSPKRAIRECSFWLLTEAARILAGLSVWSSIGGYSPFDGDSYRGTLSRSL